MAVTRPSNFDRTVQTIADRNAITKRVNGMVITVVDAIADPDVGAGTASYRWNETLSTWLMTFKNTYQSMSFDTEEITIANGVVLPSHIPADNQIWDVQVLDGDIAVAYPRIQDLTIGTSGISGLDVYNGYKLRFSYGYGTISQQLNSALAEKADVSYVDAALAAVDVSRQVSAALSTFSGLPDMTDNAGMVLTTDGVNAIWAPVAGGGFDQTAAEVLAELPTV